MFVLGDKILCAERAIRRTASYTCDQISVTYNKLQYSIDRRRPLFMRPYNHGSNSRDEDIYRGD